MGFVSLEKDEMNGVRKRSVDQLQNALHANVKQQMLLAEVVRQLKAEGDHSAARRGNVMWMELKDQHTELERLHREARRR